ncbi:MAG: hypothetical protein LBU76_10365 [Azoarcus sp.]|jgi:hypothetical protein|nr:hypothetical protein [Azoarcus sp.]
MANDFDYYIIFPKITENVPILRNDDKHDIEGISFLYMDEYAKNIKTPVHLRFNPPVPKKPKMVDHLSLPSSVFSQKVYDVLEPLNIKELQLVPVIITGEKSEKYNNYWVANIYNCLECFDKDESIYEIDNFTKSWESIEKLVLDKKVLSRIPLKDRLIFVPKETSEFTIYHKTIVDIILSVNPEGVSFVSVEKWCEGIQFGK